MSADKVGEDRPSPPRISLDPESETVSEPLGRYRSDDLVLAEIGREIHRQATAAQVCIPRKLADDAVAAWERDETEDIPHETPAERQVRQRAGALALVGLAIQERGRIDGDVVLVEVDSWQIGDALNAADDLGLLQ